MMWLFPHLHIVMQHRTSDMSKSFSHDNHPCSPSLSDIGKLYLGKKSDIKFLTKDAKNDRPNSTNVRLLDGDKIVFFNVVWDKYIPAASKNPIEKSEERAFREKLHIKSNFQETVSCFSVTQPKKRNCLHPFPTGLPL